MERTVELGKVPGDSFGYNGRLRTTVTIRIEQDGTRLAISGAVWKPSGGDIVTGGQCQDTIRELFPDSPQIQRLCDIWDAWHLNDMKAGCEHQRAEGWDKRPIDPAKPTNAYGIHYEGQQYASWNLLVWVREDEHPEGLMCRPCPVCGYKYGTAWLTEPLPAEIVAEVTAWEPDQMATDEPDIAAELTATIVYGGPRNPLFPDDTTAYTVTLHYKGRKVTVPFYMGSAHTQEPEAGEVLEALISDGAAGELSFEEFCSTFGYDPDVPGPRKSWRQCQTAGRKVHKLLGDDFDAFA